MPCIHLRRVIYGSSREMLAELDLGLDETAPEVVSRNGVMGLLESVPVSPSALTSSAHNPPSRQPQIPKRHARVTAASSEDCL